MKIPRKIIIEIKFLNNGHFGPIYRQEKQILEKFCCGHNGKTGHFELRVGEPNRSLQQNRFFHGPVVGSFVRLTGLANPSYWKSYLKQLFLIAHTDDGRKYIRSTSELSVPEFARFIDQCLDHLADEGGYLLEYEKHEWDGINKKRIVNVS